jgi:hypothetical protein
VPELVDEDQQDERDAELPAPEQGVGGDRHRHRPCGREELELEERGEEGRGLPDQEADRHERRRELA